MTATYAFLAIFTIQILAGSVLCPALFIRRLRADAASFPVERFAELFPGVDKVASTERFIARFRIQNMGIAVLGLLLLAWLFTYAQRPGWDEVTVFFLVGYLLAQMSPQFLIARKAACYNMKLKASLAESKRKAVLQRRGLFDFVSPFVICLLVVSYFLFAGLVLYVRRHPYPGFDGPFYLGTLTLVYACFAFLAYRILYGKTPYPLQSHADRLFAIGIGVKSLVYTCIGFAGFSALNLALGMLHLERWVLFEISVFFLITSLLTYKGVIMPRRPKSDLLDSHGPLPPGTGDLSV